MAEPRQPTPLALKIADRIRRDGPIPVADYMDACLQDPEHGYYRTQPAIGAAGDFVTAPEISQIFGELIGIWMAVAWRAIGAPASIDLVELGPGRGTLLNDALRAGRIIPGFLAASRLQLVESNAPLRDLQQKTLSAHTPSIPTRWHNALSPHIASDAPVILIANEFLDALPVRQLVYRQGSWHERCVGLDAQGQFTFTMGVGTVDVGAAATADALPEGLTPQDGDILEVRADAAGIAQCLSDWADRPVAALFIDYGHERTAFGDTLQAVHQQKHVPVFERPGQCDLTTQVDFQDFSRRCAALGLTVDGPITQTDFLMRMGLAERSEALMSKARPDQLGLLEAGIRRIADPFGMGGRFKVMCVRSKHVPMLPPFTPHV